MDVIVAKIDQVLFSGKADALHVPGSEGEMTILPHHSALISILRKGKVSVRSAQKELTFDISEGILEVGQNRATVLL